MVLCLSKRHDYYKRYHKNHLDMRRNYFFSELYHDLSKLDLHATKLITIQLCRERCFFSSCQEHTILLFLGLVAYYKGLRLKKASSETFDGGQFNLTVANSFDKTKLSCSAPPPSPMQHLFFFIILPPSDKPSGQK